MNQLIKNVSPSGQVRDLLGLQALTPSSWQQSCRRCPSSRAPLQVLPACLPPPLPPPARPSPAHPLWARSATAARQVQGLQKKNKATQMYWELEVCLTTLNKHPVLTVRQHHPQLNTQSCHLQASVSSHWANLSVFILRRLQRERRPSHTRSQETYRSGKLNQQLF